MPKSNANLALKGLDEMFSTEESRQEQKREQVQQIPIEELFPFKEHPFKVLDDEAMQRTVESVAQYGVLAPLIARPRPEGGYEIISGHRRQHAAELAGLDTLPVIVREMTDDAAVILMVDSNLQRENILPSERAFAYKMKLEALKNQGARSDLTSAQIGRKLEAADIVGQEAGESRNQVRRFIRLTNLIPELLDLVDEKKISFNPAVELSYLDEAQQRDFLQAMERAVSGFFNKMSDIAERKYGDPQVYLAAVGPARDLSAILLEEAPGILPCFDETDDTFGISKELPVAGCYNPKQVLELSGKRYLTGPVVFVRFNMEGEYVSLTMGDLHCIQEYLEQHSTALMADGKNLNCICLD